MNTRTLRSVLSFVVLAISSNAHATLIDFESSPDSMNVFQGVLFSSGYGGVGVGDFGHQSDGRAMVALFDHDPRANIRMNFPGVYAYLAFDIGNDDPHYGYTWGKDITSLLTLYLEGEEVLRMFYLPNGDDIMNETIISDGVLFDEAVFQYVVGSSGYGAAMAEIIDNVVFKSSTVPEPGTMALLGLGLVGLAFSRKKVICDSRELS